MNEFEFEIYVHIPFCVRKCAYCDFLSAPAGASLQKEYFRSLRREIEQTAGKCSRDAGAGCGKADDGQGSRGRAVSVYFGGGTPSYPDARQITDTLQLILTKFDVSEDAEITIECNPGTLTDEKLRAYRDAGFNRLSLGLQTSDDALLKKLGRIHTFDQFRREYASARRAGFQNISVDLMYALPGQSVEGFQKTLSDVLDPSVYEDGRGPEHLSAYSLIIEEGTPFWERYHEDDEARRRGGRPLFLPDEDAVDEMLAALVNAAGKAGMHRYEISNFARPGYESRHNTGYWIRRPYFGFGLGASSQIGNYRYKNCIDIDRYVLNPAAREEVIRLDERDEMEETLFLGLRLMKGVSLSAFEKRFGRSVQEVYPGVVENLCGQCLLEISGDRLRLTDRGTDVANLVMSNFIFGI